MAFWRQTSKWAALALIVANQALAQAGPGGRKPQGPVEVGVGPNARTFELADVEVRSGYAAAVAVGMRGEPR